MNLRRAAVAALTVVAAAGTAVAGTLDAAIGASTDAMFDELVRTRRFFHAHPELSNREVETGREIARRLRALGLEVRTNVAHTGVIGVLHGELPGPVVAWRSDIDALPITEQVDVAYRSVNAGVMHACGHDVHMTVGLGAAEVLAGLRDRLHGTVIFLFQPAEEGAPEGEEGGASLVLSEGALTDPAPAAIFGMHVMPTLPAGTVALRAGGIMAAADRFTITVHGRMSHGSAPQNGVDAVVVGSEVVSALQTIAAREIDPRRPVVVSVGSFHAGNRFNIIADTAELEGTVRSLDEATHDHAEAAMRRIVAGVCGANRAVCDVDYDRSNPVTVNDPSLTAFARGALEKALGSDAVTEAEPLTAAEDFAYYGRVIPAVYGFLGVGSPDRAENSYLHTPTFDPDEDALRTGVRAAASLLAAYTEANAR